MNKMTSLATFRKDADRVEDYIEAMWNTGYRYKATKRRRVTIARERDRIRRAEATAQKCIWGHSGMCQMACRHGCIDYIRRPCWLLAMGACERGVCGYIWKKGNYEAYGCRRCKTWR